MKYSKALFRFSMVSILFWLTTGVSACIIIENQANRSYIKNTCTFPVRLSVCKGRCTPRTPRSLLLVGMRKPIGTRYDEIHYQWCY